MTAFGQSSSFKKLQNNRSLLITADGAAGEEVVYDVPSLLFTGSIMGSAWYKIDNANPVTDTQGSIILENPPNIIDLGIHYDATEQATFSAFLNASEFETEVLFDADTFNGWSHLAFYINWQNPADSVFFYNGAEKAFATVPTADSTIFEPAIGKIGLQSSVVGTEWAHLWMLNAEGVVVDKADFVARVLPRLSNGTSPYSLGKRGGVVYSVPWTYFSFQEKEGADGVVSNGLINDVNGAALNFGAFTGYVINASADIQLG